MTQFADVLAAEFVSTKYGKHFVVDCANRTKLPTIEFYWGDEAKAFVPMDTYSWNYHVSSKIFCGWLHGVKFCLFLQFR